MIKLKVKNNSKNDSSVVKYTATNTNSFEHISAMVTLYKQIKANSDMTDEDVISVFKKLLKEED